MAQVGSISTRKTLGFLAGASGVPASVAALSAGQNIAAPAFTGQQVIAQNVSPELAEHSVASRYPLLHVYCAKVVNQLREKFRTFSGEARMVVEARVSQDRLEGLEALMQLYVDAVTQVLDQNRGDWRDGVFYGGGYEVEYGAVKHGGRNFLQIAKISFALEISAN